MKKLLLASCLVLLLLASMAAAQSPGHLLITEFAVTPTVGEFVEIYNPTDAAIDLTSYYITDATFAGGSTFYYKIVEGGGGGGGFGDFHAQFPAGAMIAAGEHQTIALNGSDNFAATYGVDPTYELYEDGVTGDAIPDLLEATAGSIGGQGGLSNSGEVLVLYYWDGASDLVKDVDYVVWGDKAEAIDKSGETIDGPDADTDGSTYAADTPIADQHIVDADNDGDGNPHDDDFTAQRRLDYEDVETWTGGNGINGHDETSENTSWLGGIWSINEPATPGYRALGKKSAADSLTIADVQFVRAADIGPTAEEDSPFNGDTLSVTGIVMHGTRELNLGARWGAFIEDERGGPWSGFFVIQNDTTVGGTLLSSAQAGDKVRFTGIVSEFPGNASTQSISQFVLITDPATPVEFLDFGLATPAPILLQPNDIGATGSSEDPQLTERLESTLVRFEGLTVLSNFAGQPGNIMIAGGADGGQIALDDYFAGPRTFLDANNGVWPGFPAGTRINVTGFMRDVITGGQGRTTINPVSFDAIEVASSPPEIAGVGRSPVAVASTDNVVVSATIADAQTSVATAEVNFRVDGGAFSSVSMTNSSGDTWEGTIPAQADGAQIDYFLTAADTDGDATVAPGDTAAAKFFYFVRDAGLGIFDLQFTPFATGNSSYSGLDVTVTGIATTDSSDFSFYFIQDGTDPWHGISVQDNVNNVKLGDEVTVTGSVRERFGETQIFNVTSAVVNSSDNAVPGPIVTTTGELGTPATAEAWEGMFVRVENVTVTNERPDGFPGFGEFTIDDGSGGLRVDDLAPNYRGQTPSDRDAGPDTTIALDDQFASIAGIQYFSFGNYKLLPRSDRDVDDSPVSVDDGGELPLTFGLDQNYPNPFNPETTILYRVAELGDVKINIFNILGQKVRSLVNQQQPPGSYRVIWNGQNDAGRQVSTGVYIYQMQAADFVQVQKMLFIK